MPQNTRLTQQHSLHTISFSRCSKLPYPPPPPSTTSVSTATTTTPPHLILNAHVIVELLGPSLLKNANTHVNTVDALANKKVILLYFSAHWCGPCRHFTPLLTEFYDTHKEIREDDFEVVFVSSDRDMGGFSTYFGCMPWLALPFGSYLKGAISSKFSVRGIPTLIALDAHTGEVVSNDGR